MSADEATSLDYWSIKLFEALKRSASIRQNEMELREDIDPVIRQAAKALYGLEDIAVTAERNTASAESARSPYDKAYGGVIVEWEKSLTGHLKEHAASQAVTYLTNLRTSQKNFEAFSAVVCDGNEFGFLVDDDVSQQLTLLMPIVPNKSRTV